MKWLAGWDFSTRVLPALPVWVGQLLFGLLCTVGMIVLRAIADLFVPSVGPFALIYPPILVAALFGRWLAGLVAMTCAMLYTWYFVIPVAGSFTFGKPDDAPRMIVNVISLAVVIMLAEIFRRAVADSIDERELLLREIDHRVKNNFASVSGLLQMQRQRAADPTVERELGVALSRIESFATAHRFLYRDGGQAGLIDMRDYLDQLCAALSQALPRSDRVAIRCESDPIDMPRDRAISIGLIINELVTNAVKHAFPDDRTGRISVSLRNVGGQIELVVADDGCGLPEKTRDGSLGHRLIAGFVRQAAGELSTVSSPEGTTCRVVLR